MAMNNSLAEVHPELVSEWSEKNLTLTSDDITFGSNKKVWWRGVCGHECQTSVKALSIMSLWTQKMRQSLMTSLFLFLLVNIQETMAGLLLSLRRYLSNAGKINIKNTFLTSLYGGKCTFLDV